MSGDGKELSFTDAEEFRQALRELTQWSGIPLTTMASRAGTSNSISRFLNQPWEQKDLQILPFLKLLEANGFRLVIKRKKRVSKRAERIALLNGKKENQ